jgi:hypothetical protein
VHQALAESPDGKQWSIHRNRGDSRVHAGAIRKAGIHQGRGFVYAPPDPGNDFLDDPQQVRVILEFHRRAEQFAVALDVDQPGRGHQNIRYGGVLQQRLQRTESEDFVQNLFHHALFFEQAEWCLLLLEQLGNRAAYFRAHALAAQSRQRFQVDAVQQLAVDREFQLLVFQGGAILHEQPADPARFLFTGFR